MNETMNETKVTPMEKNWQLLLWTKRNLFFSFFISSLWCSASFQRIGLMWKNDITKYLPDSTETRRGLTVMNEQFVTYGTAKVMISNISYEHALELQEDIEGIEGVASGEIDHTEDHYHDSSALFDVTFDGTSTDDISLQAMDRMKELLADYDVYYDTEVGDDTAGDLAAEMQVIVIIAAVIIVIVLTLTSRSYAEVPVLIMTFGMAAVLNMGNELPVWNDILYFKLSYGCIAAGTGNRLCDYSVSPFFG